MSTAEIGTFMLGAGIATNACGWVYWYTVARMRREDVVWRNIQRQRIDELAERSERLYDQSRRELGLPPRAVS
jgi:hypothetical protein